MAPQGQTASAFELLSLIETTYRELPRYADSGSLEVRIPGQPVRRFAFETRMERGAEGDTESAFLFRLDRVAAPGSATPWKVVWTEKEIGTGTAGEVSHWEVLHWDVDRDQIRVGESLAAELAHHLPQDAGWRGGADALPVPALLLGLDVLRDPDAAALDGEEPCGATRCQVVALSRLGGAVEMRLTVEPGSHRVRRAEVEVGMPEDAPLPATAPIVLRWEIEPRGETGEEGVGETVAFTLPVTAKRVESWEEAEAPPEPTISFGDVIDVGLTTVLVRVVDRAGRPVPGLTPDDFRVLVIPDWVRGMGREPIEVPVVAVDWVTSQAATEPEGEAGETDDVRLSPDDPWEDPLYSAPASPETHRVLLFVQSDVNALRTRGHMKFLPWVEDLLEQLPPGDPVAVVGFDSHLDLWLDFTLDRERTYDAVWDAIHFGGRPETPRASEQGLLFEHLDFQAAKKAALPEKGLEVAAKALIPLDGPKTVVWLGWGLGRYGFGGVRARPEYRPALRALDAARATVFVIDVSDAAYHDLEFGLKQVAKDTGGTYAKAHERPDALIRNLVAASSGHYLLRIDTADLPRRPGDLEVELVGGPTREGRRVLFPPTRWRPPAGSGP